MEECICEPRRGACQQSKKPPDGVKETVFITKGGYAFHIQRDCLWLVKGQGFAERQGMEIHPVKSAPWSEAPQTHVRCRYSSELS